MKKLPVRNNNNNNNYKFTEVTEYEWQEIVDHAVNYTKENLGSMKKPLSPFCFFKWIRRKQITRRGEQIN